MLLPSYFSRDTNTMTLNNNSPCSTRALLQIKERIRVDELQIKRRRQIPFDITKAMQQVDQEENTTLCQTLDTYLQQRICPFCGCDLSNHNARCRTCGWRK